MSQFPNTLSLSGLIRLSYFNEQNIWLIEHGQWCVVVFQGLIAGFQYFKKL